MGIDSYKKGSSYENFMRRAFNSFNSDKQEFSLSTMRNLIDAENGEPCVSHLPSAKKQLEKVKGHIYDAFDEMLSKKKYENQKSALKYLQSQANESNSSDELMKVIEQALELTN
jgi:predicted outer membrane protein